MALAELDSDHGHLSGGELVAEAPDSGLENGWGMRARTRISEAGARWRGNGGWVGRGRAALGLDGAKPRPHTSIPTQASPHKHPHTSVPTRASPHKHPTRASPHERGLDFLGRGGCDRIRFGEIRFGQSGCGAGGDDAVATGATQVEIDCCIHTVSYGETLQPQWLRSAGVVENSSLLPFRSEICDLSSFLPARKTGERADRMTFVIAERGNRVAGAGGES